MLESTPIGDSIECDGPPTLGYHLPNGDILRSRYRGKRTSSYWRKPGDDWTPRERLILSEILCRDVGLSKRAVGILLDRGVVHFLRIQDFINNLIDSLWLADPRFFLIRNGKQICPIKRIVRKIVKVGTYDLPILVQQWKDFAVYLRNYTTEAIVSKPSNLLKTNNIFLPLVKEGFLSKLLKVPHCMRKFQIVSHLLSSRHLPYMGKRTEEKALSNFKSTLSKKVSIEIHLLTQLEHCATRVGEICKKLAPAMPDSCPHISLDSSGELNFSINNGGQASAVWNAVQRHLLVSHTKDFEEKTPFGLIRHKANTEVWRYLYRETEISEGSFDGPRLEGVPKDRPACLQGLDEVLGKQLLYTAWKDYRPCPIPIRASTVPEPGNKARIVTVSPYWLNLLQSPLAHVLKFYLKWHPSCYSSFFRQDQTWSAAQQLCRLRDRRMERFAVLSSDMKNATDTIDHKLARRLVIGFWKGLGFEPNSYLKLVLSTLGPREIQTSQGSFLSKRGIMMGECMAKPILTLLNLVIEELAFMKYHNWPIYRNHRASPDSKWRFFHIGGDDHLAFGPLSYLNRITRFHRWVGSQISEDKHAISKVAVTYCERMIFLQNLEKQNPRAIAADHDDSVIVDSVKVRLMTRSLSTQLAKDEKNVAVGKARQLAGSLRWLPGSPHWSIDHKKSIRDLFIKRMRGLLPTRFVSESLFYQSLLPLSWGGLDLYVDNSELYEAYLNCPQPTRWLINRHYRGEDIKKGLKLLRRLNTNGARRGIPQMQQLEDDIVEDLELMSTCFQCYTWQQVKDMVGPSLSNKETADRARLIGLMTFRDFAEYCSRGDMFTALLLEGVRGRCNFNTIPYNRIYRWVWSSIEDHYQTDFSVSEILSEEQVISVLSKPDSDLYIDTTQKTFADFGKRSIDGSEGFEDFQECSLMEVFTVGKPSLIIGKKFIGM